METGKFKLDYHKLSGLYVRFQHTLRSLDRIFSGVPHDYSVDQGSYSGIATVFALTASEHILHIANIVNRFSYDLNGIAAWAELLEALTEEERLSVLFEFVTPTATHCLCAPYGLRQAFIKSVCRVSHQTNRFRVPGWNETALKPDRKLDAEEAEKLAEGFVFWPPLRDALARLDDAAFRKASDYFRNEFNHGFPRRIEFGNTVTVERDPKAFFHRISDRPPLHLSDLLPPLTTQHEAALACYEAYTRLIKEQRELLPGTAAG